jgi:hypothetical protein
MDMGRGVVAGIKREYCIGGRRPYTKISAFAYAENRLDEKQILKNKSIRFDSPAAVLV